MIDIITQSKPVTNSLVAALMRITACYFAKITVDGVAKRPICCIGAHFCSSVHYMLFGLTHAQKHTAPSMRLLINYLLQPLHHNIVQPTKQSPYGVGKILKID